MGTLRLAACPWAPVTIRGGGSLLGALASLVPTVLQPDSWPSDPVIPPLDMHPGGAPGSVDESLMAALLLRAGQNGSLVILTRGARRGSQDSPAVQDAVGGPVVMGSQERGQACGFQCPNLPRPRWCLLEAGEERCGEGPARHRVLGRVFI